MSNNVLFEKKYISDLQNALNKGVEIHDFNFTFNKISLGCINIVKQFDDYVIFLSEDIDKDFFNTWNNSICKYFIRDIKKEKNNLYKTVYNKGVYFLIRKLRDKDIEKFADIKYLDEYYSVVSISETKDFTTTYTPSFKLWSKFLSIKNDYDYTSDIEDNDELTSKALFDEEELSN